MTERTDKKLARLTNEAKAKQKEIDQIKAQTTAIQNRQKSKLATEARKLQTRRKILLGAYLMGRMERELELKNRVLVDLEGFLKKPHERKAFDLSELTGMVQEGEQNEG
jgi:division protein CdvB (Snf7/Vps24/ESCRT-III family)